MLNINLKIFSFLALFLLFGSLADADEESTSNFYWGKSKISEKLEIGFEYSELEQNNFDFLGIDSYTFFIGRQFQKESRKNWGWRFLSINVPLSTTHLMDENNVRFITGNRANLSGKINHKRLYLDYYPSSAHFFYSANLKTHILKIEFIPGVGIGYSNWFHRNYVYDVNHDLKALTIGGNLRIKTVFFDLFFIEYPFLDFSLLALKNRGVKATIGDVTLDRPEFFALTALINIGMKIEF
ncbi:hypothetical protein ACFL2X_05200 [Candidatus Latescibacterota bacterium]